MRAALLFAALTLLLTYPLSRHPGSTSLGSDPDVHLYTWTLAWNTHKLFDRPWTIFDANIYHPYDNTLAWSENLIGSTLFAAPVLWITGNPVLAMNAVALVSVMLCGLGGYLLARRLGLSRGAAVICGIVFAFSPARFFRFPQLHLTTIQWIPFTLAYLHTYLDKGGARNLRLAIAFFSLQALTSLHGIVYLVLAIVLVAAYRALTGTPIALRQRLRDVGVAGVALLLPALLLAPPYLRAQRDTGLVRTLENWIVSRESYLASPTTVHSWLLERLFATPINERADTFLFPGYLPLVLAAIAVATAWRHPRRRDVWLYVLITVAAFLFAAGPPLSVWPYVYWWPVLNFIRVPARFFLLSVLGLAVVAAFGLDRLAQTLRERWRPWLAAATGALLIVEFLAIPLPVTPYRVEYAAADRWLATQPGPFAIAEVPVGPFTRYHSTFMLHSMAHWQPTVHGHSGVQPTPFDVLYDQLRSFPSEASLDSLDRIDVDYVVMHVDWYQPGEWAAVQARLAEFSSRLTLVFGDATSRVYRLRPPG